MKDFEMDKRTIEIMAHTVAMASREHMAYWYAMGVKDGNGPGLLPGPPEEFARLYATAWQLWDQVGGMDPNSVPFITITSAFQRWVKNIPIEG